MQGKSYMGMHSNNIGFVSFATDGANGCNSNVTSNAKKADNSCSKKSKNGGIFTKSNGGDAGRANGTQVVSTFEEGNALVKRLKQLEHENCKLASTLSKMCEENAKLSAHIAKQEKKCLTLANMPLSSSSVLHSLFEPEKTGWFAGSKSAAREKLEQLLEELQNEFVRYQASHTSSNEEVQALIGELQSAHMNAQNLSAIVKTQQEIISRGPLAVTVRVVSGKTEAENISLADLRHELERRDEREEGLRQELRRTREELQAKALESNRHLQELQSLRAGGAAGLEVEHQHMSDALAREQQLHELKEGENVGLSRRVGELERQLREAATVAATAASTKLLSPPLQSDHISELQRERDAAKMEIETLEARLKEMQKANEHEVDALRATIVELENKISQSVPQSVFREAGANNKRLSEELEVASIRVKQLEVLLEAERGKNVSRTETIKEASFGTLGDAEVLATLERNNERVASLELQRNQLIEESKTLRDTILAREEELIRVSRTVEEDKQRISFLLQRCVTMTDDLNSANAEKEAIAEKYESGQLELNKLRRQIEEIVELNQRVDELKQKNEALQARLSTVEELENQLIKAKETIAFMEVTQGQTMNMSQYAELQSINSKLENTLEPIKRQLEDAQKKLVHFTEENESLHAAVTRQQNTIKTCEEKEAALQASEDKLREKANQLTAENARINELNETLEKQMTDMQDGIKEMAVKMEQERLKVAAQAEAIYKGELDQLKVKLRTANETLEYVRLAQDSFVPEGIHKAVEVEKERLAAELVQKTFELDKLKSEILIYRQTINDLESENEEHVHQIEFLHSEYQKEHGAAAERLAVESNKLSSANAELDQLRSQLQDMCVREERLIAQNKTMEEAAQKNLRAFEDKCCREERLLATVAATSVEMEQQQRALEQQKEEMSRLRTVAEEEQKQMKETIATLSEKLQCADAEKERLGLELAELQCATRGSNGNNSDAAGGGGEGATTKQSSDESTHYARAEQLLVSLIQTQHQLEEQKTCNIEAAESFQKMLEAADANARLLQQRVQQLESELEKQAVTTTTHDTSYGTAFTHPKKKKKSLKKFVSVGAGPGKIQLTDGLRGVAADGSDFEQQQGGKGLEEQREEHNLLKRHDESGKVLNQLRCEVSGLRDENAQLKEEIVTLQQELQGACDELDRSEKEAKKKTAGLQEQIYLLEAQSRKASSGVRRDTQRCDSTHLQDAGSQAQWELLVESSGKTAENLSAHVQRLQLEVQALARELLPTKNKLIEYMAMADRLGIQYPFSADMEAAALLRLKTISVGNRTGRTRACSVPRLLADHPCGAVVALEDRERKKKVRKQRHKLERQTYDTVDLR